MRQRVLPAHPGAVVLLILALGLAACSAPPPKAPATAVVVGDPAMVAPLRAAIPTLDVPATLTVHSLSAQAAAVAPAPPDVELGRARTAYVNAAFDECLALLAHEPLVDQLLAEKRRGHAARVLFWKGACHAARGDNALAESEARQLAARGLGVPEADAASVSPDIETMFSTQARAVRGASLAHVQLVSRGKPGSASVDGADGCVVPCGVEVATGRHTFVLEGDLVEREVQTVDVADRATEIAFRGSAAPSAVAASRWTTRYAASPLVDSSASLALLALAVPARNVVLVQAESGRLKGATIVSGVVAARAERTVGDRADLPSRTTELLGELLVASRLAEKSAPLYARPLFWITVGLVAGAAALGTYYLVRAPERRTEILFQ